MSRIRRVTLTSSRTSTRLRTAFFPAPLALAIALSMNAHAATIVVDSADADSEPGKCTIVDAVAAVNTAMAVNNCIAGDGDDDTIDLSTFTTPTTIEFASATDTHALVLTNAVTINGPLDATGNPLVTLTRSAVSGTSFGLIHTVAPLTVNGLAITNGNAGAYRGGAILSGGALTVTASVISHNSSDNAGGGLAATGKLTVQHSIVSYNTAGNAGGGLYGGAGVEIDYSTIANNSTTGATATTNGGGGLFAAGPLTCMNADVLNNTSASAGGGAFAAEGASLTSSTVSGNQASNGSGGGIYSNPTIQGANLVLSGSTIDSNSAQGNGGGVLGGAVGMTNATITGNSASGTGGGVQADSLMTSYATIAQNQSTGAGGGANFASTADVEATILYGNTTTANAPDDIDGPADITGQYDIIGASTAATPTGTLSCDPNLVALADNGGPTRTMALSSGSCAIDGASSTPSVATDQRGYTRPVGSGANPLADIGAYEFGAKDPDVIFADGFGG